jgi:integrase
MRTNMNTAWLTAELRKPRVKSTDFTDTKTVGLTLRITPGGGASWSTRRILADGRYSRVTLGNYPAVGLSEARKRALNAQSALSAGRDPVAEKRAIRAKAIADRTRLSVADAWQSYAHTKTASGSWGDVHARNAQLFFGRVVAPALATRALADVTRHDWTKLVAGQTGQGAKSNALRFIRGFDAYAEISGWVPHAVLPRKSALLAPPCPPRQTTPGDADVAAIWHAAETLRPKARVYVRLLILTAARRGEVGGIRAGEVDLDAGLWRLPAARSKNGIAHIMPLNALALDELRAIWPTEPAPVPDRYHLLGETGYTGLGDFSRVKAALDIATGKTGWRTHDLRRSARTGMARLGVLSDHAEAALNHISHRSALERTYNTHHYADEALNALRVWQAHIERLIDPGDGAEIIPLRRGIG